MARARAERPAPEGHLSAELLANPERRAYGDALAAVLREIATGADLRPRMSTAVEHAYALEPPPVLTRGRSGRQHDRLLADWGSTTYISQPSGTIAARSSSSARRMSSSRRLWAATPT